MPDKAGDTFSSDGYKYRLDKGADGKLRPTYLGKVSKSPGVAKSSNGASGEVYTRALIEGRAKAKPLAPTRTQKKRNYSGRN